jgi:hypothetical protein
VTLIALTGLAGSGKSTVADYLIDQHDFVRMKFAQGLKDMLRAIGLTDAHIEGHLKETPCPLLCGKTPREAMLTLGTEWGRDLIGPDFWCNILAQRVKDSTHPYIVVDDCRFPNEARTIRQLGGQVWKVVRDVPTMINHPSETEQANLVADWICFNNGTLFDLYNVLDAKVMLHV